MMSDHYVNLFNAHCHAITSKYHTDFVTSLKVCTENNTIFDRDLNVKYKLCTVVS